MTADRRTNNVSAGNVSAGNVSAGNATGGRPAEAWESGKRQPFNARPARQPPLDQVDPQAEEHFKQSIAALSRRIGERAAEQAATDPRTDAEKRRAALRAYELARAHRLKLVLGGGAAALGAAGIAWLIVMIAAPPVPPAPNATASGTPASTVEMASATPTTPSPAQPPPPAPAPAPASPSASPSTPAASVPPAQPASVDSEVATAVPPASNQPALSPPPPQPTAPSPLPRPSDVSSVPPVTAVTPTAAPTTPREEASVQPPPAGPAGDEAPLYSGEIWEIQSRLRALGFNPGPLDGAPGPMTEAAILHYQEARGLAQAGKVDRQLLEQLRQDRTAKVVQVAARPEPGRSYGYSGRSPDVFEPLKIAGYRLTQFLQSLTR